MSFNNNNNDPQFLVIVESPSKCKTIQHFLGPSYKCVATYGHFVHIPSFNHIDTKHQFHIQYDVIPSLQKHFSFLQETFSQFQKQNIFIATDHDREGESIAFHILQFFHLENIRIVFHEISKPAILHALQHPTTVNMDLVLSQQARSILDISIGFKISPLLWKFLFSSKSNPLSAGRCQTPALRLIYDNEKERQSASTRCSYLVNGYFFSKNIPFHLNQEFETENDARQFLEKSKTAQYEFLPFSSSFTQHTHSPPLPFNTSRLIQVANTHLNLSSKKTMSYCQQLYQEGYITYMRTTNTKLSSVFLEKAKTYIEKRWRADYVGNLQDIELGLPGSSTNEPHEAIRITQLETTTLPHSDTKLKSLYQLIWRNTVESCMAAERFKRATATILVHLGKDDVSLEYKHSLDIPVFSGWKVVTQTTEELNTELNQKNGLVLFFNSITPQTVISPQSIHANVTIHENHSYYTEAGLIKKLEDLGIGRPSTYSIILETIQERGYVKKTNLDGTKQTFREYVLSSQDNQITVLEKEKTVGAGKNKLIIQPMGILTIEFLITYFHSLFSYDYSRNMEEELDNIRENSSPPWYDICKRCLADIKQQTKALSSLKKQSFPINEEYDLVFQQFGPVLKNKNNEYKSIRKDIHLNLEDLKKGLYTYDDLVEIKNGILGEYEGEPIYLKTGKYGAYIEHKEVRKNISKLNKDIQQITLEDAIAVLTDDTRHLPPSRNVLRHIDADMSIKKGKYGAYVYYQTETMKNPEFYSLSKFKSGYLKCDLEVLKKWLKDTYDIPK